MRVLVALLLFVGVLVAASRVRFPTSDAQTTDRRGVDAVLADYVRSNHQRDADGLAELYTSDALLLPPDEPPVVGHDAIKEFWADGVEPGLQLDPLRVEVTGDQAAIVSRYTVPARDDVPADSGKCVLLLKRESFGRWKITTDIWNTSTPKDDDEADDSTQAKPFRTSYPAGR